MLHKMLWLNDDELFDHVIFLVSISRDVIVIMSSFPLKADLVFQIERQIFRLVYSDKNWRKAKSILFACHDHIIAMLCCCESKICCLPSFTGPSLL